MANDLRFALRMICSHRLFSAAVVATLALGIGLNTMVFTLINAVLFKPVPVPGGAQLVALQNRDLKLRDDNTMRVSYPDFREYRAQTSSLAALEAASDEEGILSETGIPPQAYRMEQVSSGIFGMMHIQPVLGRGFLPGDDKAGAPPVVVLGYGIWKERYNSSPNVLGRQVRINEKPATIVGVMPKGFKFPTNIDMWTPLVPTAELEKRTNRPLALFGMLKPESGILQANVDMNGIARRLAAQYPDDKDIGISVETFHEHYNGGGIRLIFLLMMAAVGFVLLIACANVANMMLSRALSRQREMSIRSALGASRWRVVRQLLIESVLLSTFGGVLGLGLAAAGSSLVRSFHAGCRQALLDRIYDELRGVRLLCRSLHLQRPAFRDCAGAALLACRRERGLEGRRTQRRHTSRRPALDNTGRLPVRTYAGSSYRRWSLCAQPARQPLGKSSRAGGADRDSADRLSRGALQRR